MANEDNPFFGPLAPLPPALNSGTLVNPPIPLDESKLLICRELYNGGFSELIGARDLANGSALAIKRLDFSVKIYKKFPISEIKNRMTVKLYGIADKLKQISQMNVMKSVDFILKANDIMIVMEMCNYGDFFNWVLQQGSFTEFDAIIVMQHILKGIRYLHDRGYTHGDLKPNNIVFQTVGPYSVIIMPDISLMKEISKVIHEDLMILDCYAPELLKEPIEKEPEITKEMDIWSLGVIGYIMISGLAPFVAGTRQEMLQLINGGLDQLFEKAPWKLVHYQTKNILTSLLDIDPVERGKVDRSLNDRLKNEQVKHKCVNLINFTESQMLATCRRYRLNNFNKMEEMQASDKCYK